MESKRKGPDLLLIGVLISAIIGFFIGLLIGNAYLSIAAGAISAFVIQRFTNTRDQK